MKVRCGALALAVLLAPIMLAPTTAPCQSRLEFAEHLLRQGDSFRAITLLKELAYFSESPFQKQHLNLKLGEAYRKSGRPTAAMFYYARVLSESTNAEGSWPRAQIGMALAYVQARSVPMARITLDEVSDATLEQPVALTRALIAASEGEYSNAGAILSRLEPGMNSSVDARLWQERFEKAELPHKSPALAGGLSLVLPGAGQLYSRHYSDALQAFAFVFSFGLASFAAYQHAVDTDGSYVGFAALALVTATFHGANVLGAVRTAQYRNLKTRQDFVAEFRLQVLELEF